MAKAQNAKAKKKGGNANRRNVWLLVLTTVLVLGSIFMFTPPQDEINQGLDIQGGLSVVLSAKSTDGDAVTSEDMEKSRAIIEQRVNALGASEAVVQLQGSDQIQDRARRVRFHRHYHRRLRQYAAFRQDRASDGGGGHLHAADHRQQHHEGRHRPRLRDRHRLLGQHLP